METRSADDNSRLLRQKAFAMLQQWKSHLPCAEKKEQNGVGYPLLVVTWIAH